MPHQLLAARAGYDELGLDRERIYRGGGRPVYLLARRARRPVVPDHLHGHRQRAFHAVTSRPPSALICMSRRTVRKFTNALALGLSGLATAIRLAFLGAILWTLIKNGLGKIGRAHV